MSNSWPERQLRHVVLLDASVTRADGTALPTTVSDLSLDGCRITGIYRIGERITLKLPKIGVLPAIVRWSFLGRSGACFIRGDERSSEEDGTAAA